MNLENLRGEVERLAKESARAYDAWAASCDARARAYEQLKREEIRAELLAEQANDTEREA